MVPPSRPRDDDLADPYQAPEPAFALCAELVDRRLARPLDLLAGAVAVP
jgi:hypothetical protein